MKRFVAYRLVAAFCCLAFLSSVYAQSIKTFDREVCSGASIYLNGGLYQILSNDCEVTSIKANGTGAELYNNNGDVRITLTATTEYHIAYKDNTNPSGTVAKAKITVITPPSLKVTVTSPKPLPAAFCKDTKVTLNATQSNTEVYWTISSDATYSKKGTSAEFTLTENCRISAQSYNACGFVDTSIYFPVISDPDLSNARLILNSTINGTFCIDCGFFPRTEDIVLGATQGTIKESSVTWEDGTVTEETIKAGLFTKKVKVHAVVEQSAGTCGASSTVSRAIDTVINLTVSGGIDCKPTVQTTVSVKPCRDGEVQLRNYNKNLCTIQGRPTLTADPVHPKIVIQENKDFPYDQGSGRELYRWNVRWENYAKTDAQPSLTANANYSIACPYSKSKPSITGTLKQKVSVTIDTSYLTFKYEYCPDSKATLEIKGQEKIVTIKEVTLTKPEGVFSSMFSVTDKKDHQWACTSVDPITTALLTKYAEIRIKVKFDVKDGNCQFTLEREEIVRLKQKNNCTMEFQMVETGPCIGEPRTFRLANADGAVTDYIEVDPHPVFTFKVNAEQCTLEPYYAGAPGIPSKKDSITATIYYHMQGTAQTLSMTKKFEMPVTSCPPAINDAVRINSATCPTCPGAEMRGTVTFNNPTTKEKDLKVEMISTSVNKKGASEKYTVARREYTVHRYLFGDMDYRIAVTYNEGDSIYVNPKMSFTVSYGGEKNYGESVTAESIKMADVCGQEKDAQPDSVCEGEMVDLYVYSRNFLYDTLKSITWSDPSVRPEGTGIEEWADYQYTDSRGTVRTKKIKRFHYRVEAKGSGIYPFVIRTKIRDSLIEHRDTIRVAILAKPRIFIQDTVYACSHAPVDLWKYVDSSAVDVRSLKCPAGMVIGSATDNDYRAATADLRYNCSVKNITETINIKTQDPVYNAFIPDAEYCPGESVTLNAKTNGRVTWTRRHLLEGGGLSQADTLVADGSNEVLSDQMGKSDQLYIVTAKTGCNQPPFQTVQFWALAKPVPTVNIVDNSVCKPAPFVLEINPFDPAEMVNVEWKVNNTVYSVDAPYPSDNTDSISVWCKVEGTNGCVDSNSITMYSYNAPKLKIMAATTDYTGKVYCASGAEQVQFTAQGADSYLWSVASKPGTDVSSANAYILNVESDDILYLVGSEGKRNCQTKDSVSIVLKPKAEVQSDTIACLGEHIYIAPVTDADTRIGLKDPAGNECACAWIDIPEYKPENVGVYVFSFERKGCRETRNVRLDMYPVPQFEFTDTAFCEDDRLRLDVKTGMSVNWVSQSRFIWRKDGNELQDRIGNSAYTGGKLNLSDAGDYELEIRVNRCVSKDTVSVRVDAHSHPSFPVDSFYCEGSDFETVAEDQGNGASYEWYSANRPFIGTATTTKLVLGALEMDDNGYLKLTVYRGACVDDTSIFIHVRSMPHPELKTVGAKEDEKGFFYCEGSPIRLDVPDAQGNEVIEWYHNGERIEGAELGSYGISSSTLENGGLYVFKVERNGCFGADSLYVGVRPLPEPLVSDTFMCSGHIFAIDASNPLYPGATFSWLPQGTTGATAEISTGGQYSVVMTYEGCEGSKSFVVDERPSPSIGFPTDTVMCQRDSILLAGPDAMEIYRWQDGASGQTYMVNTEGLYTLYVELMGCSDYNEVFVHEDFCSNLYFPSAFTPNGDGNNDFFAPITTAVDEQVVYSLYIYNRSGEKVFESHSMTEGWDGNFKGSKCPAGVYIYRCKAHAKQNGRNLSANGTVTLIR